MVASGFYEKSRLMMDVPFVDESITSSIQLQSGGFTSTPPQPAYAVLRFSNPCKSLEIRSSPLNDVQQVF
jgi:hypothetical protein